MSVDISRLAHPGDSWRHPHHAVQKQNADKQDAPYFILIKRQEKLQ